MHPVHFCSGSFGDGDLENYLPWLALNLNPPDFSLSSSWDYRHELLHWLSTILGLLFASTKRITLVPPLLSVTIGEH
jgi:hypothetical protein